MRHPKATSKPHGDVVSAKVSPADDSALLKRKQLARAVNASPRTIDNWQRQRKIPFIKISPRCIRYHLDAVLAALQKYEVKAK